MDAISQVVLVGAATRMPKIQEHLSQYLTVELSKNINTDEAAVLGAVYKAADLSKGFKVKKFVTKDAVLFPIHIVFDRTVNNRIKQVRFLCICIFVYCVYCYFFSFCYFFKFFYQN